MVPAVDETRTPAEVVHAVLDCVSRAVMGDASALDDMTELYADPTYVLHPMRPDLPPVRTHDDFRRHASAIGTRRARPDSHRAADVVVRETTDPELVVTEFHYETIVDGQTLITPCIWVTRVRNGRIVEARDYNGERHAA
ncbi:nuclear transport factor 2 family protein [Gryllotalpicola reticulitermitis]|uniref:Nuclear transport factor 2 family protein n=1 Tax=Gryllotalpicola reticulitermitis TaxID=1184153 RepID=A0ABV8Q847_9MICO